MFNKKLKDQRKKEIESYISDYKKRVGITVPHNKVTQIPLDSTTTTMTLTTQEVNCETVSFTIRASKKLLTESNVEDLYIKTTTGHEIGHVHYCDYIMQKKLSNAILFSKTEKEKVAARLLSILMESRADIMGMLLANVENKDIEKAHQFLNEGKIYCFKNGYFSKEDRTDICKVCKRYSHREVTYILTKALIISDEYANKFKRVNVRVSFPELQTYADNLCTTMKEKYWLIALLAINT